MYFSHKGSRNASPEVSCSDCKMELVQKTWTKLLLHWLNRCVNQELHLKALTPNCLVEVINRYKGDIVDNDIDRAILCTDDLEPFLRYKYPILRLRYFTEDKDAPKKLYIMSSVLLYHCCISSHTGAVENDICNKLPRDDREMILKFCENLSDMEITINNVEVAIQNACDFSPKAGPSKKRKRSPTPHVSKSAVPDDLLTSETESIAISDVSSKKLKAKKVSTLTFKASVTVMPSHISVNNSSFSKTSLQPDSSLETSDTYSLKLDEFSESTTVDSVAVFSVMEKDDSVDSRSCKRDSITSSPTKETVVSRINRRGSIKSPAEQVISARPAETREAKMEKYRDATKKPPAEEGNRRYSPDSGSEGGNRRCSPESGGEETGNKRYSPESGGIKSRLRREVCCLPPDGDAVNMRTDSSPCMCTVTTSEDSDDMSAAVGDVRDCNACDDKQSLAEDEKKAEKVKENSEKDKMQMEKGEKKMWFTKCQAMFVDVSPFSNKVSISSYGFRKLLWRLVGVLVAILFIVLIILAIIYTYKALTKPSEESTGTFMELKEDGTEHSAKGSAKVRTFVIHPTWAWQCTKNLCMKVYKPQQSSSTYSSLSRCILLCTGPQLWPHPLGMTYFSKELVGLATDRLEYKFQALPSDMVNQYLAEAFRLFLGDLARLERIDTKNKNRSHDIEIKKMHISMEVESDSDPRMRVNTDESYYLKVLDVDERIKISINSPSFAGVRHGLETLSQIILLDQTTGNLITLSEVIVKDAPSYKYRGLMLDTARNYIPLHDILRTVDGMATCKLNTLHWRITDSASFPLLLPSLSNLFEFGAYDRSMVYTKQDVKTVVNRAGVRGIRVLMEVAIPGPVGRAWSWSDDATCPRKNDNFTCENVICLRLKMQHRVFELLQHLYSEIIDMTGVEDMFHMSDSVFTLGNCYYLIDEREGFLEKALERLRRANKGFLPKLPIIWYTQHLAREMDAKTWERYGVQVYDWPHSPDRSLSRYKVIHSGRWDLSCDVKKQRCTRYRSWQEMYSWKSWRNLEVFSVEGGEALLWTDLVDSGNLDFHLWPRAAAVAERLWSDLVANATASGDVYIRLDNHRWRMLLRGLQVQPIWPVWCSFNPAPCLAKLLHHQH